MSAASQARRVNPSLQIEVFEKTEWVSYSACGIPYLVAGDVGDVDQLIARTPAEFRERHIDVRLRHEVVAIDAENRKVEVRDHGRGRTITVPYDELLVATGARPREIELEVDDPSIIHGVQTLDDGIRLLEHARRIGCKDVVVVGAGYIGLEIAEAFVKWRGKVTVVTGSAEVMPSLDPDMGRRVRDAMIGHGIEVVCGQRVTAVEGGRVHAGRHEFPADLVVIGAGVQPNSEMAAAAGIPTGINGAIDVDHQLRTAVPGVWAAGDCATSFHRVTRQPTHVALGTVANKQGRIAGENIGGGYATFPGVLGTAITRLCELEVARTGLSMAEAGSFEAVEAVVETSTGAGYMPESRDMVVKVVAERRTGRLLGAQITGGDGAAKRIDAFATALWNDMTVHEMAMMDLSYAPPFSPVWDAVLIGARKAAARVDARG